jgi:RNA polymerase sigma-70 factor (ECF subfamily)
MEFGAIDGEPVLLVLFQRGDPWQVALPVRVHVAGRVIDRIEDYYACPRVIGNASESDLTLMTGPIVLRGAAQRTVSAEAIVASRSLARRRFRLI